MTIWQNVSFEDEATIGDWAKSRDISYSVIKTWEASKLEADDLLIVLGGSMSAYDDLDFIKSQIDFLTNYIKNGGKVFGICLGAQLIAKAMGAEVYSSGEREAGWREITIKPHFLTSSIEANQTVFHWHGDTFALPKDTVLLASNDAYENQAFATIDGKVIATQFHFEVTKQSINNILNADGEYLNFDSAFVFDAQTILKGENNIENCNQILFEMLDIWRKI
ncbi:MAG: GMP synthase [Arcobacter sp.]|nr:GMP synthase [Arcobacter sp.]